MEFETESMIGSVLGLKKGKRITGGLAPNSENKIFSYKKNLNIKMQKISQN